MVSALTPDLTDFLADCGIYENIISPMTPGASFRDYYRVIAHGKSYVVMEVPVNKPLEDGQSALEGVIRPFITVGKYLNSIGIHTPKVYNVDESKGFLLLEDLGNNSFYHQYSSINQPDSSWYYIAVDALITLASSKPMEGLPKYDVNWATIRGDYFLEDYLPAARGGYPSSVGEISTLKSIIENLYSRAIDVPWGTILWDYHSPNLIQIDKNKCNLENLGVIDFQDAKHGPISYDLASLLYDARYKFPKAMREELLNYFMESQPGLDKEKFVTSFVVMGLLRNIGVVGRFSRMAFRDGKKEFLPKISVVWPYIEEALQHPDCAELKEFLDEVLPENRQIAI